MNYPQTTLLGIATSLILFIVAGLVWLLVASSDINQINFYQDEPSLDSYCFEWPSGYEFIGDTEISDPDLGYICRNLETGQYRACTPQIVECEQ